MRIAKNTQLSNNKPQPVRLLGGQQTSYLQSLLHPEVSVSAKIPGQSVPVVALHRKQILRANVNALGCFSACMLFDGQLQDNTNTLVPLWFNNNVLYDATSPANVTLTQAAYANPWNIPANTVKSYRFVSGSILCRSLASALTRTGDLHIGFVNGNAAGYGQPATTDMINFSVLTNFNSIQGGRYAQVHLEKGRCAHGIFVPQDLTCLDFKNINATTASTDNFITIIGIGLPAGSTVEFEIHSNYEVTPQAGSILYGMETISQETVDPLKVWRIVYDKNEMVQSVVDNACASNAISTQQLLTSNIFGNNSSNNEMQTLINRYMQSRGNLSNASVNNYR